MAYDTKKIKRDVDGNPIPQVYNTVTDEYEVLQGASGAAKHDVVDRAARELGKVSVDSSALPTGAATAAKQDTIIGHVDGVEAALAPLATAAKQDTLAGLVATAAKQDALAGLIGEVKASPAENTLLARIKVLETELAAIKSTAGIKKIVDQLPAGTNLLGKTGIDQTTDGTTNRVVAKISQTAGENLVQLSGSKPEQASEQDTQVATTVKTYTKPAGASQMEVYCETGYIRVRTDGETCTGTTGEPIAPGFGSGWQVDSISVYFIQESVITVVSR